MISGQTKAYHLVRSGYTDIKLSTIEDIIRNPSRKTITENGTELELPFINCKYRARVRVVDMWPLKLENFTRSLGDPQFNPLDSAARREELKHKFEWSFVILVEDAVPTATTPERLLLTIGNEQGQNLLKMDAVE